LSEDDKVVKLFR